MAFPFLGAALLIAILNWVAVGKSWKWLEYIAKPGVMAALLVWLGTRAPGKPALFWFEAGLVFSLAGDVLLMLPRQRFIGGLVAFLLAHLAYIVGFNPTPPPLSLTGLLLTVMVVINAWQIYQRLSVGVPSNLTLPVAAYLGVISGMMLSALLTFTRPEWALGPALLVSVGAALFFFSDSVLAWDRFVTPVRYGRVIVMVTYHLGQMALVAGAAWHYRA